MADDGDARLERILLVEDDGGIRAVTAAALEMLGGWTVCDCATSAAALAAAADFAPQLLVSDVMMAGVDGPQLVAQLRAMPGFAELPVVFVTASVGAAAQGRMLAMAPLGVIVKPFDPMVLVQRIVALWRDHVLAQAALSGGACGDRAG